MTERVELKPCPFCGGDDQYLTEDARDHGFIGCHDCHARGPIADQVGGWTRPYAAWNRRADLAPDPLRAVKVRDLVWMDSGFEQDADLIDTTETYQIQEGIFWYAGQVSGTVCESNEAAKAAAQQDYENRIRSALEPDPLSDAMVKALVKAASEQLLYMDMCNDKGDLERNLRRALAAFDRGGKDE